MSKRFLTAIITALTMLPLCPAAGAQEEIHKGDYVRIGSYQGLPMMWRCIDVDENGPLMLSDKIINLNEFDAGGHHEPEDVYGGRYREGSNRWSQSNLRCWLNSDARSGENIWLCGNEPSYDGEDGFLHGFTETEKNAVKEVTHKCVLDQNVDKAFADGGEYMEHNENSAWGDIELTNQMLESFDTMMYENVTEKVFLLDMKQWNDMASDDALRYGGGISYSVCTSMPNVIDTLEADDFTQYFPERIFLRAPMIMGGSGGFKGNIHGSYVVLGAVGENYFEHLPARAHCAVRPAFYLDTEAIDFYSGKGTGQEPYILKGSDDIKPPVSKATPTASKILVDGNEVNIQGYNINYNNYFRLRDIAAILKGTGSAFDVAYDPNSDIVLMASKTDYSGTSEPLTEAQAEADAVLSTQSLVYRNKQATNGKAMYVKMYNIGGYNYCKLRDVGESGSLRFFDVDWDEDNNSILITSLKGN